MIGVMLEVRVDVPIWGAFLRRYQSAGRPFKLHEPLQADVQSPTGEILQIRVSVKFPFDLDSMTAPDG